MAEITAQLVKELRDRTGVGMGKCKEALQEAGGDIELAIKNLRKAGMASAAKKSSREAKEGMIGVAENDRNVALVELNAETDFVVMNDRFQKFLSELAEEAVKTAPSTVEAFLNQKFSKEGASTIDEYRASLVQSIGENIQISRIKLIPKEKKRSIGVYSHLGGKIVTAVILEGSDAEQELAREIAMHAAAAAPEYLNPESVPHSVIEHEKEIAKSQVKGKPENIIEKILTGKINAYFDQVCLIRQPFIKDDSLSINELVQRRGKEKGNDLKVVDFLRWEVGQG